MVGTVAVLTVGVAVAVQMQSNDPTPNNVTVASGRSGALADGGAARCVDIYSPKAIATRAFAFDGTVVDIEPGQSDRPAEGKVSQGGLDLSAVTFEVHAWFRGGDTAQVTVDMSPPATAGFVGSESGPSYQIGSRLLVSGEPRWGGDALQDAIAWGCGFTRYYDEQTAEAWQQAVH